MPTNLILKQAFVWGAGIGAGVAVINSALTATNAATTTVANKIRSRRASKA